MVENHFKEIRASMLLSQMPAPMRREAWACFNAGSALANIIGDWEAEKRPELHGLIGKFSPEKEIEKALASKFELIAVTDPRYAPLLRSIDDAPFLLYARGRIEIMQECCFAVVGARHASYYGMEQARRFSRVLADAGLTIVSGMALGIDQSAHEAVLDGGGNTVAVLGCGADVIYPAANDKLYQRLAEEGLILSEYPLGTQPLAHHFPRRNRILAGLSLGVLVVEAHERSGSLITAYQALEQGREVFSMPGPVHHITSRGTHRLIREGAALVEAPEEILITLKESVHYFPQEKSIQPEWHELFTSPAEDVENDKIYKLIQEQNRDYDALLEVSGMAAAAFARMITELEVEGRIKKNPAGYYETA